jgi:iron complex outermembrane receptor protein
MRLSVMSLNRDGYYKKNGLDDADQKGGRFQLLWKPDDRQQLRFSLDAEHSGGNGVSNNIVALDPVNGPAPPAPPTSLPIPSDRRDNTAIYGDAPHSRVDVDIWGAMLQYDYSFDPATLTVQLGNRETHYRFDSDEAAGQYRLVLGSAYTKSAEVRLTSNETRPLQWVGGLFLYRDQSGGFTAGFAPTGQQLSILAVPGTTTKAWAAFGQATYTPPGLEQLHLTAGGRYNHDDKTGNGFVSIGGTNTGTQRQTKIYKKFTYKLGAAFDITPQNMIFANFSTGYKAGGFVYGTDPIALPQTIKSYEIGSKNRFLENRLQLNFDLFKYDYENFEQVYLRIFPNPIPGGPPLLVLNVASTGGADIKGAEMQAIAQVTQNDQVSLTVNYLDAKFVDLDLRPLSPALPDLSGQRMTNTPTWAGTFAYSHTFELSSGELDANLFVRYAGKRFNAGPGADLPDGRRIRDSAYTTVDLSARYTPTGGSWYVQPYVNNLTKTTYLPSTQYVAAFPPSPTGGRVVGVISPPRTFGVIVGASF